MHHVKDKTCAPGITFGSLARPSNENVAQDFDTSASTALFVLWRLEKLRKAGKEDSGGRADYALHLREYVLRLQSGKKCLIEEDMAVLLKLSAMPPGPGIIAVFFAAIKGSVTGAIVGGFGGMSIGVIAWGLDWFPGGAYWGAVVAASLFGLIGAMDTICEPEKLRLVLHLKYEVYEKHRDVILG